MNDELYVRPVTIDDARYVMEWVNDPEVVKNFQHFGKTYTEDEERAYLQKLIDSKADYAFSIFRKSDGAYIGQAALNQISYENKLARLSLTIKRSEWGKGYAQIAILLILAVAFFDLDLHKVWLMVYESNEKARHIYQKLGFREEGILRQEYFWRGEYHDMVRMSILIQEFLML